MIPAMIAETPCDVVRGALAVDMKHSQPLG